jgi:CubicO group peptidase (beta-lactamase class C family)
MDIESKKPMQKDAIFQIMSMTKPVVGVSILMMIEQGKLRLTDPVSRFIPEFKEQKVAVPQPAAAGAPATGAERRDEAPRFYTVPADRDITIRDLLSHVSGLGSGTISRYTARAIEMKANSRLADIVPQPGKTALELTGTRGPAAPPRASTRWHASSRSCRAAVRSVHQAADSIRSAKDTYLSGDRQSAHGRHLQRTPEGQLERQRTVDFMNGSYFSGGGGLLSTAEDYLQFGLMLMQGGQHNGKRLLSPRSIEMMAMVNAPDTLPGRTKGEGYGLSVRVVTDPMARGTSLSEGTFGWSGAWGTHFWVDREQIVAIEMIPSVEQRVPSRLQARDAVDRRPPAATLSSQ